MHPYELTLADASRAIAAKELSPVELTESVLARAAHVEEEVSAFATPTPEAAMRAAARAQAEIAAGARRGPLHGIPLAVKDIFDTAGTRTAAGSRVHAKRVPDTDSAVVAALKEAGAVLVGKTHTHEFAYGTITPATRNPWATDHVAGGSSGGSAAAVASGGATAAIGSDTGGSIRIPAALCGVVGLKPTHGLVSRHGAIPLSWTLDHVGPITRTVEDAALVLDAVAGHDPRDPATLRVPVEDRTRDIGADLTGLRIGMPGNYFFDRIEPDVEKAVRSAIGALADLGAELVDVEVPLAESVHATQWGIMVPEAAAYHQDTLWKSPESYGPDVRVLLEAGELVPATDYLRAQRVRTLMRSAWARLLETVDVVAAPTVPITAVPVGQEHLYWPDSSVETVSDAHVRLCAPANLTGLPALTVPTSPDSGGLPSGLQLIGRPLGEATLVRVGSAYEHVRGGAGALAPL
jgi:aspartyl-tRNA(Asn)/glutamyl-tRNA(Gln) amidotransferase subunit A